MRLGVSNGKSIKNPWILPTLKSIIIKSVRICLPFLLAVGIMWWMFRDIDWHLFSRYMGQLSWPWMLLSLVFGVLAQQMRAWRWQMTLAPLGYLPRRRVAEDAIFLSYASSLVIPRVGEVMRCGTLKRYDRVPFTKGLGTVVTERLVDCAAILLLTVAAFLLQLSDLLAFLRQTGTDFGASFSRYTGTGYIVTALCIIAIVTLTVLLARRFKVFSKGNDVIRNLWAGISSLRGVRSMPLYLFFTFGTWACYYLHFYLAFFCFDFTSHITPTAAFLIFCAGTFAVLVPTPNGAGPWHFVVKTLLVLYGVAEEPALFFVLIVHSIQTAEVILLGAFAWADLWRLGPRPAAEGEGEGNGDAPPARR